VIIFAATAIKREIPAVQNIGGLIGAGVSGTFLWIIWCYPFAGSVEYPSGMEKAKAGTHDHAHLNELLSQRGFINRLFGGRLRKLINHSWQMDPVGFLFGLGFDTASEVGLLCWR
jgi:high-affinity nickel-transport protein